jgi:hypothetical protein
MPGAPRGSWMALIALAACTRAPRPDPRAAARDDARAVLAAHCGACHEAHLATARPGALAVFDLDEREWAAPLSDALLGDALGRLGQPLLPDGSPNDAGEADQARFRRYLELETAARAAAPPCPGDELLEAVHAAAFHLEHGGDAAADFRRAATAVSGPLDSVTRDLLSRLRRAAAAGGDVVSVTEDARAQLADWRCLSEEAHRRFHTRL